MYAFEITGWNFCSLHFCQSTHCFRSTYCKNTEYLLKFSVDGFFWGGVWGITCSSCVVGVGDMDVAFNHVCNICSKFYGRFIGLLIKQQDTCVCVWWIWQIKIHYYIYPNPIFPWSIPARGITHKGPEMLK